MPQWPFAGALVALLTVFGDLFLMDWLGGIADYHRLDKICDPAYMTTFTVVALRWRPFERNIALALLWLGLVGDALFELTAARAMLCTFPKVFELWFIFFAARDRYPSRAHNRRSDGGRGAHAAVDGQGDPRVVPPRGPVPSTATSRRTSSPTCGTA